MTGIIWTSVIKDSEMMSLFIGTQVIVGKECLLVLLINFPVIMFHSFIKI